jgi:hypothetical protein
MCSRLDEDVTARLQRRSVDGANDRSGGSHALAPATLAVGRFAVE